MKNGVFIIKNYSLAKPFSSFFPGIGGIWGIPIWAFYVNRGQAIAGFGTSDKENPIMEYEPANKAYQYSSLSGFRTFVRVRSGEKNVLYDAFNSLGTGTSFDIENRMEITASELRLIEINHTLGFEVAIDYFTIPNDNYGGLARILSLRNLRKNNREIEIFDGLTRIIPYGINNWCLKMMSRTIESWIDVENLDKNIPYLRLKVDPSDRPEVVHIKEGNFYGAFDKKGLIKPVVDPEAVFGCSKDFVYPERFMNKEKWVYPKSQITKCRIPCSMVYKKIRLSKDEIFNLYSIIGNMDSAAKLDSNTGRIFNKEYLYEKRDENNALIRELQSNMFTNSASKEFDAYCGQTFLDNLLRGGYPITIEHHNGSANIQVYSRKHGDLERDYNNYLLEPTYFSQGNGNFRDVNQNRRSDIWFNPKVKSETVKEFFSFVQADGYNPLVIKPSSLLFNDNVDLLKEYFDNYSFEKIANFIKKPFTPGELFRYIEQNNLKLRKSREALLKLVLENSKKITKAEHGEGFWIDHWHYSLDLLENYLSLYPEEIENILIKDRDITFYDNSYRTVSRDKKYKLINNRVFQFGAVVDDNEKKVLISNRNEFPNLLRMENGNGAVYKTSLLAKMLIIISNKFASLDPFGCGIEMESDRPNWYDALNGLPGILGSSTCETFELKRWIEFILEKLNEIKLKDSDCLNFASEMIVLFKELSSLSEIEEEQIKFWDASHKLKENYWDNVFMGISGKEEAISIGDIRKALSLFLKRINKGLGRSYDAASGLYYSYFINDVCDFKIIKDDKQGSVIKPLNFKQKPLPFFLEGLVHSLKVSESKDAAKKIYRSVRNSPLFDKKLKMYKVNAPLNMMPEEIGRCRIFTPGWLENESIWLHMEYKYALEVLKNGLYEEFFADIKNIFIPFQDAKRYGRSILENSSFLVSSAFSHSDMHGNGFVARLSGSTSEFISMWLIMCLGRRPFYLDADQKLCLQFKPVLPSWFFTNKKEAGFDKNTFAFKFLNKTVVTYHNPKRINTFDEDRFKIEEINIKYFNGEAISLHGSCIPQPYSEDVREGKIEKIDLFLPALARSCKTNTAALREKMVSFPT